ncbi:hypothetical protein [Parendozoicomonas haliclonae]|uniref:Uncharacterized protein n=1 Tax=Parendozoicomonas haliclonae TaxID=1960125 RepID=A0A1X7AH33_9GAMM|nr:hypothetical protein [Parendozoicomonas haliclonae]SMA40099.1 hypothetical protein EHSB41UT_01139 [Parendozoicomonas haliclonae]
MKGYERISVGLTEEQAMDYSDTPFTEGAIHTSGATRVRLVQEPTPYQNTYHSHRQDNLSRLGRVSQQAQRPDETNIEYQQRVNR